MSLDTHTHTHTHVNVCLLSHFSRVQLFATLWTRASQAPLSMGFSRQEYWSALPCPPPGDLPDPGIKPVSPALKTNSLPSEPPRNVCACVLSHFSCVPLFATLRTVAHQTPLSIELSRQEYWSALPCPPPGDLPNSGVKAASVMSTCIGRQVLYH